MDKMLLDIICPASSKRYDFWIPKNMPVKTAVEKLADEIGDYEGDAALLQNGSLFLYSRRLKRPVSQNGTMEQAGIQSGDTLMLV